MHYKNGRPATEGDPVILRNYDGVTVGKIHSLNAQSDKCNCIVAEVTMGGVQQLTCMTVGEMYHAADAFESVDEVVPELETSLKESDAVRQTPSCPACSGSGANAKTS